jgi:hypothetical protein
MWIGGTQLTTRVACKTAGCTRTILAATAARTGGYCMPCVQAKERQQREAHIRANRRNVNPYDGIDDALELLKLMHSPPKPDPLICYALPPRTPAALYAELDSGQIAALVRHAHTLLKKGDTHTAQHIAACLVAFVSADISSVQQELISVEGLQPGFVFHRAAPKIRNLLTQHLARVAGHDRLLTDKLLSALAWVGDERVVELFAGWRTEPPSWAADLYIPPYQYAKEAGWELSPDGDRRNLYHEICYPLIRSDAAATPDSAATILTDTNLFELDGTSDTLTFLGCRQHIVVPIADTTLVGDLPRRSLVLADTPRSPWHAAIDSLPTQYSQIGGHPTWIQDAEYPTCGKCSKTMPFIGQISCEDVEANREGIFYAFLCADCAMTASTYQQT